MTKTNLERENARLRAELDDLRAAAKEIWEGTQFYLQQHEIEELRDHLADQLEMFEGEKEVQP
jgi:regulator of replication initiation timing